jgi:hypothetical protein
MDVGYTVFVHLVDAQGRVAAQHDSEPGGGELPTTSWLPGEVIADPHLLAVAGGLPPGQYVVQAGVYDARTGARLPIRSASGEVRGDVVELGRITAAR